MSASLAMVADVGEGFGPYRMGDDLAILDQLTSANIACGFHAGDPTIMDRTVAACVERGISIGAHPGFQDRFGFGRRMIDIAPGDLRNEVIYQLGALSGFAAAHGSRVSHLTAHGLLGNLSVKQERYAAPLVDAVAAFDPSIRIVSREGELTRLARERGLGVVLHALADRGYIDAQTLVPRTEEGAVIHDTDRIVERIVRLATEGVIIGVTGEPIPVTARAVLVHGDTPGSASLAGRIRETLVDQGVTLVPIAELDRG